MKWIILLSWVFSQQTNADISLDDAVQVGLSHNLDLIAAKYNISLAEADELTAGLRPNPSITVDAGLQPFGKNWNQTNAGGPKQNDIVISYPVDLSGKRSLGKESAHEATRIAEVQFKDAIRQKILDIRLAYLEVVTQEAQLELNHEREESLSRLVRAMEQKIGAGGRLPLLQTRAQLAYHQAQLDTQQRQSALRGARAQLTIQLGRRSEDTAVKTSTQLRDFSFKKILPRQMLVEMALAERADITALRLTISKSDTDQRLAKAQAWDNFTLTAGVTRQGPTDGPPTQDAALSWSAGLTIPLPLFNRNQGNVERAQFVAEQTKKQLLAKELAIGQEIDGLIDQLSLGQAQIEAYESSQLKRARIVRDNQQRLFGTGSNSLLDYFDSISAYQLTLSSYYDSVADYRRNVARLSASVGKDISQ